MKRPQIGDVYYTKVPNGYKLYQWAYSIPRKGEYIRVFPGLYETLPSQIDKVVTGPHSYIISFHIRRAYRIGLANKIENCPVPNQYPFPKYSIWLKQNMRGTIDEMELRHTDDSIRTCYRFSGSSMIDLPKEFQSISLLHHNVTPNWLLYLFDIDFDLSDPEKFFPGAPGTDYELRLKEYTDIVNSAMNSTTNKTKR